MQTIDSSRSTPSTAPARALVAAIARMATDASIELNVQDVVHLEASRAFLPPRKRVYVSYLPKQTWQQSVVASIAVRAAGFEPVPHLPVRLLADRKALDQTLAALVAEAGTEEVLLIAGDYATAAGPYWNAADVLRTGALERAGIRRVSLAGHPEGHPQVALELIRDAERQKIDLAARAGLQARLVTQFVFESEPLLKWLGDLRAGAHAVPVAAGLAGPAKLSTLLKFALRCGAGPSIRALGARPGSIARLLSEHGPETLVRTLAGARLAGSTDVAGIHLFCFGGFLRSCEWLHATAAGRIALTDDGGFVRL